MSGITQQTGVAGGQGAKDNPQPERGGRDDDPATTRTLPMA
jgi:hypothetical protein